MFDEVGGIRERVIQRIDRIVAGIVAGTLG